MESTVTAITSLEEGIKSAEEMIYIIINLNHFHERTPTFQRKLISELVDIQI